MNRVKNIFLVALSLLVIQSCGKRGGDGQPAFDSVAFDTSADTVKYDPVADSIAKAEARRNMILNLPDEEAVMDFMRESGHWDRYSSGIIPQMVRDEIGYAKKLLANEYDRFIIVDKHRMKVILFDKYGVQEASYGMACAKNYGTKHKKADSRTPEGFFSVSGIYDSTDWLFTDDNGVTSKVKGQFGPRFIRLRIPGTSQIGIHGTCAPWSIGGRRSHGCIRITNENILALVEKTQVGMPVIVSPGERDMKVNMQEGYDIPSVATVVGGRRARYEVPDVVETEDVVPAVADTIVRNESSAVEPVQAAGEETNELNNDTIR